jgi:hypothetical protein
MNIIIDIEDEFLFGFKRIRASIKIGDYKHAVIATLNNNPFYLSEQLYIKKTIFNLKKELELYLSEKLNKTK